MSRILPELAAAVAEVAEARARVPAAHRPWRGGFDEIKAAAEAAAGNRERALELIGEWRDEYLAACSRALLYAPLEVEA